MKRTPEELDLCVNESQKKLESYDNIKRERRYNYNRGCSDICMNYIDSKGDFIYGFEYEAVLESKETFRYKKVDPTIPDEFTRDAWEKARNSSKGRIGDYQMANGLFFDVDRGEYFNE